MLNIERLQSQTRDVEIKYDSQCEHIFDALQFLMIENKEIAKQNEKSKTKDQKQITHQNITLILR